jgi:hypothetical protein
VSTFLLTLADPQLTATLTAPSRGTKTRLAALPTLQSVLHSPFYRDCSLILPLTQVPTPSNVLGVFGLSIRTRERDLEDEFSRSGRVEKVVIVYDQRASPHLSLFPFTQLIYSLQSERSRGFGFVTMADIADAERAIADLNGIVRPPSLFSSLQPTDPISRH